MIIKTGIFILVFGLGSPMISAEEILTYRVVTGKKEEFESYRIKKTEQGYTITCGDIISRFDNNYSQIYWKYTDSKSGHDFCAERRGKVIVLYGIFKGKRIKKEYTIENGQWTQSAHFSLDPFIRSTLGNTRFWFISPHDLAILEIEAKKLEYEQMTIGDKKETLLNVRIRPTGFAGNFWHGDYWFRKKDSLFVRYRAVHGPPGTPPTIKEIESNRSGPVDRMIPVE
ncbi:MAG: hypothetical protein JW881_18940 [Spirochaetales bacterium]|nr:hypothetical protein [Spirochaetales bacterium]